MIKHIFFQMKDCFYRVQYAFDKNRRGKQTDRKLRLFPKSDSEFENKTKSFSNEHFASAS